jgi:hypothetical protein
MHCLKYFSVVVTLRNFRKPVMRLGYRGNVMATIGCQFLHQPKFQLVDAKTEAIVK